jgi:hypothetical protein
MISISNLPTEILLQIIEESLLEVEHLPVIGENAAWRSTSSLQIALPNPDYRKEFPELGEDKKEEEEAEYKSPIIALRL